MFDFIKNIFKKGPRLEQIVEVEVKPKRKYKPRVAKTEVEVTQPAVIGEALADPVRPRIMTKQLVGSAVPAPSIQEVESVNIPLVEPVVEVAVKAPVKKKPVVKKPATKVETPVEPVAVVIEPVVVKSVSKKPENKPKAPQNKPPRGKNKKR